MPETRVLRQLLEALLFEGVASWSRNLHRPHAPARELAFRLGRHDYRCRAKVGAFGRVRVAPSTLCMLTRHGVRSVTWRELLADVPGEEANKSALAHELASTIRLCRWNAANLPELTRSRRDQPYTELERLLHEGHPYHPCFKARSGFTIDDHAAYGPEAGRPFELRWLAVRRSALWQSLPASEPAFLTAELGADTWRCLARELERTGAPEHYGLLPVHPWQFASLAGSPAFAGALARRELVELGPACLRFRATQSLRTLMPLEHRDGAHLKLPLAVRISSSLRTLEPETVRAAPAISSWLRALVGSDPFFEEEADAVVLAEHASAIYQPCGAETAGLESNLAVVWREPVTRHLRAGESAVPYNALFAVEADGAPFIGPWIARYGLQSWLRQLLRVTLLPLWRLLVHHGIALEAHAQNLVLLQRDGLPARLALRDFHDSLEYVPRFLAQPKLLPDLSALDARFCGAPPGRYHAMASEPELGELFADALLVFNLSELSWLLQERYAYPETAFWKLARATLAEYRASRWDEPERDTRLRLGPQLRCEGLLTARLRAPGASLPQHLVPNMLHAQMEREIHAGHQ